MDKNTLKMVLVMALVVFGFSLMFQKPKSENQLQQTTETVATTPNEIIDSIRPYDLVGAADYFNAAGQKDAEGNSTFTYGATTVTVIGDNVEGTVTLNDSTQVSYADVVANHYPAGFDLNLKRRANASVREALAKARQYRGFASSLQPTATSADAVLIAPDSTLEVQISAKGAFINRAVLYKFKSYAPDNEGENVVLFSGLNQNYGFEINTSYDNTINTADFYYTPRHINDSTVEMVASLHNGGELALRYTIHPKDYIVTLDLIKRGISDDLASNTSTALLSWAQLMPRQERGRTFEERNSGLYYKYVSKKPDDINGTSSKSVDLKGDIEWIGFKNQFFSTVFIPKQPFIGGNVRQIDMKNDADYVKDLFASTSVTFDHDSEVASSIDIFMGPNLYPLLRGLDDTVSHDDMYLTRLIPLGWSWCRWINTLIIIPVFNFLSHYIANYGLIILILTLFIKLILFPFTYKSYLSQARMRLLAPEIKEINEKYPGPENAAVRSQKTMALYSRAGASPLSGCLPLLLQMPILIAMFSFFPSCIELRGQSFLWVKDLAAPDVIATLPFSIPFYGKHVSLFCLLMTVTNIIYTRINMKSQPSQSEMPGMKWMMYLMPLMFLFFFNDYAAALSYYYFLSLLITIIQTYVFRRCVNEQKLRRKMAENAAKPKKKSGFMARMEEVQRQQQAKLRQQQQEMERRRGGRR